MGESSNVTVRHFRDMLDQKLHSNHSDFPPCQPAKIGGHDFLQGNGASKMYPYRIALPKKLAWEDKTKNKSQFKETVHSLSKTFFVKWFLSISREVKRSISFPSILALSVSTETP